MVNHEGARVLLETATSAVDEGDYRTAWIKAAEAFALGWEGFLRQLSIRYRFRLEGGKRLMGRVLEEIGRAAEEAAGAVPSGAIVREFARAFRRSIEHRGRRASELFEPLTQPALMTRFGIDPEELDRFEQVTPVVHVAMDGQTTWVALGREGEPSKDEASFAVDFAARSLVRLDDWLRRNARHRRESEP